LVNLIAAPKIWSSAQTQIEVAKTRRRALSVAALVQINIGYQQYLKALDSYDSATQLSSVDQGIYQFISNSSETDTGTALERIHAATAALASQLEREQSLAEIYAALGNIYASIGLDPAVGKVEHITVRALAVQLEKTMSRWYAGHLPKPPRFANPTADLKPKPKPVKAKV
jgi:hypothetical protein